MRTKQVLFANQRQGQNLEEQMENSRKVFIHKVQLIFCMGYRFSSLMLVGTLGYWTG
jgi:hypothetical protein